MNGEHLSFSRLEVGTFVLIFKQIYKSLLFSHLIQYLNTHCCATQLLSTNVESVSFQKIMCCSFIIFKSTHFHDRYQKNALFRHHNTLCLMQ